MNSGVLGLGVLGRAMAGHLLAAGPALQALRSMSCPTASLGPKGMAAPPCRQVARGADGWFTAWHMLELMAHDEVAADKA